MVTNCASKTYLLWYADEHNAFRVTEFESLAALLGISYSYLESPSEKPFLLIRTNCENNLLKLISRTVLARSLFELWANSDNCDNFYKQLRERCDSKRYKDSFQIQVEGFGKKIPPKAKVEKIEKLSFLPFDGPIDLRTPANRFILFEYYGKDPNVIPDQPYQLLFGQWIADSSRKGIAKFSLKKRKFIANTSMDPTLALIMANIARVKNGDLVLDPFVGSGSLLVAAADCGGFVCGTDIDYLLIHNLSKPTRCGVKQRESDESVNSNLKQYGLQDKYIDIVAADASLPLWRTEPAIRFDAIITDPPYGKRESRERVGKEKDYTIPENLISGHIPSKIEYNLQDITNDLLNFSATHLNIGGRLVFWLPIERVDDYLNNFIKPTHSCLKLISISEQKLSLDTSRLLIAMEKTREVSILSDKINSDHNNQVSIQQTMKNKKNNFK